MGEKEGGRDEAWQRPKRWEPHVRRNRVGERPLHGVQFQTPPGRTVGHVQSAGGIRTSVSGRRSASSCWTGSVIACLRVSLGPRRPPSPCSEAPSLPSAAQQPGSIVMALVKPPPRAQQPVLRPGEPHGTFLTDIQTVFSSGLRFFSYAPDRLFWAPCLGPPGQPFSIQKGSPASTVRFSPLFSLSVTFIT